MPSNLHTFWSIKVDTQLAHSRGSRPTSSPFEFVNRTTTSTRFAAAVLGFGDGCVAGRPFPFPTRTFGGCIFCLSIRTGSPCLSKVLPLLVAHASTPNAPAYLKSGIEFLCGIFGAGLSVFNSVLCCPLAPGLPKALIVIFREFKPRDEDEFGIAVFHDPSKNMLTALSMLSPEASRNRFIKSGGTLSLTTLSNIS